MHLRTALILPATVSCLALFASSAWAANKDLYCDVEASSGQSRARDSLDFAMNEAVCEWMANLYTHDTTLSRENFNTATNGLVDRTQPPMVCTSQSSDNNGKTLYRVTVGPAYGCSQRCTHNDLVGFCDTWVDRPLATPYTDVQPPQAGCTSPESASKQGVPKSDTGSAAKPAAPSRKVDAGTRELTLAAINAEFAIIAAANVRNGTAGREPAPQLFLGSTIRYLAGKSQNSARFLCSLVNGAIADMDPSVTPALQSALQEAQAGYKASDLNEVSTHASNALTIMQGVLQPQVTATKTK